MSDKDHTPELRPDPVATLVLAEIGGLIHLSDVKDAKGEQSFISGLYEKITQEIRLYDGTIYPSMGERIMSVFGLETGNENSGKNGINAALRLHAVLESFTNDHDLTVQLRGFETNNSSFTKTLALLIFYIFLVLFRQTIFQVHYPFQLFSHMHP